MPAAEAGAIALSEVTRTVFEGIERSAELGPLPAEGVVRVPGRAIVTVPSGGRVPFYPVWP